MDKYKATIKRIFAVTLVFVCALPVLLLGNLDTTSDVGLYTDLASNIFHDGRYVLWNGKPFTVRAPVFPAVLSVFFSFFGPTISTSFFAVKAIYVCLLISVWWLAKLSYSYMTAVFAVLLCASSLMISGWASTILVDVLMPFWMLVTITLLVKAWANQEGFTYYALAGIALGFGYLTKEVAAILLLIPAVMICLALFQRRKTLVKGFVVFLLVFFITTLPWTIFQITQSGQDQVSLVRLVRYGNLLGINENTLTIESTVSNEDEPNAEAGLVVENLKDLTRWIRESFSQNQFVIAPLFAIAWILLLFRFLLLRKHSDGIFLLAGLSFLILAVLFLTNSTFRSGQNFFLWILNCIVLATVLLDWQQAWAQYAGVTIATFICLFQFFDLTGNSALTVGTAVEKQIFPDGYVVHSIQNIESLSVTGLYGQTTQDAARWLRDNNHQTQKIMVNWRYASALSFLQYGESKFVGIPSAMLADSDEYPSDMVFFGADPSGGFAVTTQSHLLDVINNDVRYIAIAPDVVSRDSGLSYMVITPYLWAHPQIHKVAQFEDIQIFEVRGAPLNSIEFSAWMTSVSSMADEFIDIDETLLFSETEWIDFATNYIADDYFQNVSNIGDDQNIFWSSYLDLNYLVVHGKLTEIESLILGILDEPISNSELVVLMQFLVDRPNIDSSLIANRIVSKIDKSDPNIRAKMFNYLNHNCHDPSLLYSSNISQHEDYSLQNAQAFESLHCDGLPQDLDTASKFWADAVTDSNYSEHAVLGLFPYVDWTTQNDLLSSFIERYPHQNTMRIRLAERLLNGGR